MSALRRFLGMILYLCMAFPLLLGGMALVSVKPIVDSPATLKSLIDDRRFSGLLESPDMLAMAPETLTIGGAALDGKAVMAGFQASVPSRVIVAAGDAAVDAMFAAFDSGEAFFPVDLKALKAAAREGSGAFADAYLAAGGMPPADGALPATSSPGPVARDTIAAALVRAVDASPDAWTVGEPGTRLEAPARLGAVGAGIAGASVWLIITGAGLCFASVMVSDGDWRRRLGRLGARIIVPSAIIVLVGLVPRLVRPDALLHLPSASSDASMPALFEYVRFLTARLSGGFLVSGLVGVGVGTVFSSVKRTLPIPEDEDSV